jgi:hypothetical protein
MLAKSDDMLMILPAGDRESEERNALDAKNGPYSNIRHDLDQRRERIRTTVFTRK